VCSVLQVLLQYLPDADSVGLELTGAGKVSLVTSPPAPAKAKMDLLFNVGGDGLLTIGESQRPPCCSCLLR
jgi:hypothetical protein